MSAELEVPATNELYCATCEQTFVAGDRCPQDNTRLVRIAKAGDQLIGRELDGRYTVVEKLGQGGMGTVYRGTQHSVGREVAIKVVTPSLVSEPIVIKRFLREAKLASRLTHPNAVSVLDFGQTEDGLFYLIMELVEGRTLDKLVEADRVIQPARLIRIGAQICDALEGAHRLQIVHRDLKPANVMVIEASRDLVKVLDFGLAKSLMPQASSATMTNAGALLGTPAFMPPELVSGGECDARADLYSLGCLLHYAASGELPFVASSVHELIAMHASEPPPPLPHVPPGLARVIAKLLAKEPGDRYQTAALTREALEASLATTSAPAVAEPEPELEPTTPTVLGWAGTTTVPGKATAAPALPRTTTGARAPLAVRVPAARPVGRPSTSSETVALPRTITPVRGAHLAPEEVEQLESSPTLLATVDELQIVVPPRPAPTSYPETSTAKDLLPRGSRKRLPILLGVGAVMLAVVVLVVVRGAHDARREPASTSPTVVPTPPAPSRAAAAPAAAPAPIIAPDAAPLPPAPPAQVVDAPPPPKAVAPPRPPKAPRPPVPPKTEPTPPRPVRVNPGVM